MPDDPPVTAEEELTMAQLAERAAEARIHFCVHVLTPFYVLMHGLLDPYTREPARWPFRPGVMPEDDRV